MRNTKVKRILPLLLALTFVMSQFVPGVFAQNAVSADMDWQYYDGAVDPVTVVTDTRSKGTPRIANAWLTLEENGTYATVTAGNTYNVRETPPSGRVLGTISNQVVKVIGEQMSGSTTWYLIETLDGSLKGYCSAVGLEVGTVTLADESVWKTGTDPFGVNVDGEIAAALGQTEGDSIPAYYFKSTFNVSDVQTVMRLTGDISYNDAVVIYINNVKAASLNAPANFSQTTGFVYGASEPVDGIKTEEFVLTELSMLKEGENTIAVELHQADAASKDAYFKLNSILLSDEVFIPERIPATIRAGAVHDAATEKTVTWLVDAPQNFSAKPEAILRVTEKGTSVSKDYTGEVTDGHFDTSFTGSWNSPPGTSTYKWINSVTASGLKPGVTYIYQVGDGETWSSEREFTTISQEEDKYSFNVLGDVQSQREGNGSGGTGFLDQIANEISSREEKPLFSLQVGDWVDRGHHLPFYEVPGRVFDKYPIFGSMDIVGAMGNHEYYVNELTAFRGINSEKIRMMYGLPDQELPEGISSELVGTGTYSADYANMHVSVLDVHDPFPGNRASGGAQQPYATQAEIREVFLEQAEWLKQDLAQSDKTWKVVVVHHPIYHGGSDFNPDSTQRQALEILHPVFEEYGVQMVFAGHSHAARRGQVLGGIPQNPAYAGFGAYAQNPWVQYGGVTYVNAGNLSRVSGMEGSCVYIGADVDGGKMTMTMTQHDGAIRDQFTLYADKTVPGENDLTSQVEAVTAGAGNSFENLNNPEYLLNNVPMQGFAFSDDAAEEDKWVTFDMAQAITVSGIEIMNRNTAETVNRVKADFMSGADVLYSEEFDLDGAASSISALYPETPVSGVDRVRLTVLDYNGTNPALMRVWLYKAPGSGSVIDDDDEGFSASTDTNLAQAGDYFDIAAGFEETRSSNVAAITFTYDAGKFEYASYEPAGGVTQINRRIDDGKTTLTVMAEKYDLKDFGNIRFRVKEDAELDSADNVIDVAVNYVVKAEDGVKTERIARSRVTLTTQGGIKGDVNNDGIIDLRDLSDIIDCFGKKAEDSDWVGRIIFFDYNNNGEIDIYDISFVAKFL